MYNIIFRTKTLPLTESRGFGGGDGNFRLGLCSFNEDCSEPVKLIDVNGKITITNGENKLTLNIVNDIVSVPILIDDDITGRTNISIQEVRQNEQNYGSSGSFGSFGTSNPTQIKKPTTRFYQLSIGKLFKTKFFVRNNEFHFMAKEMSSEGSNIREQNVIEMNISFRTENGLQLISKK